MSKWKCPSCGQWRDEPMGKKCSVCKGTVPNGGNATDDKDTVPDA